MGMLSRVFILFLFAFSSFSFASNKKVEDFQKCKKVAELSEVFVRARLSGKTREEVETLLRSSKSDFDKEDLRLMNVMLNVSYDNDFKRDPSTMSNQHKIDFARLAHFELLIKCYEWKEQ